MRPRGQNQSSKDSCRAQCTSMKNVKEGINSGLLNVFSVSFSFFLTVAGKNVSPDHLHQNNQGTENEVTRKFLFFSIWTIEFLVFYDWPIVKLN